RLRRVREVRVDEPVPLDLELHALRILELHLLGEVVEDLVVVGAHVIDGLLVRDVEDLALAKQVVERDLDEHRGLADAGPARDDAEVAAAEAAVHRLLEHPHRAALIHFFAVHGSAPPHFAFLASSSLYFLMSSSASAFGSAAYRENSIVNSALPWV